MTEKGQIKNDRAIERLAEKFYSKLIKKEYPVPS
jgi:hypothetical protein